MAPLTEPAFVRLRSVDPVLAEAAGDAAFELETDLFAALAKGIVEKRASDAFPFALLIVLLVGKPTGLFGEKATDKV